MVSATVVVDVPLRVGLTPAVRLGSWLDAGAAMAGFAAFVAWVVVGRTVSGRNLGFDPLDAVAQSQGD